MDEFCNFSTNVESFLGNHPGHSFVVMVEDSSQGRSLYMYMVLFVLLTFNWYLSHFLQWEGTRRTSNNVTYHKHEAVRSKEVEVMQRRTARDDVIWVAVNALLRCGAGYWGQGGRTTGKQRRDGFVCHIRLPHHKKVMSGKTVVDAEGPCRLSGTRRCIGADRRGQGQLAIAAPAW